MCRKIDLNVLLLLQTKCLAAMSAPFPLFSSCTVLLAVMSARLFLWLMEERLHKSRGVLVGIVVVTHISSIDSCCTDVTVDFVFAIL